MKKFSGPIVFILVFALSGVAIHRVIFDQWGIFVWSVQSEPDTGSKRFGRTMRVVAAPVPAELNASELPDKAEDSLESEPDSEASKEGKVAGVTLFNGKDLGEWELTRFGGEGEVSVNEKGYLELGRGKAMTGIHWTGEVPKMSNFEILLEAQKLEGADFFCALTFPVKQSHATLILGGWGGGVVGVSQVDELDASENETMTIRDFEPGIWYDIRVRVADDRLQAWIDEEEVINLDLEGREISLRPGEFELSTPIGLASFQTQSQFRNIIWRNFSEAD